MEIKWFQCTVRAGIFFILIVLAGCKTSQQVVRDKNVFKDPTGVKTVGEVTPESVVESELRRDLDVTKGELENLRFQYQKDVEALQSQVKNLELEKEKLLAELNQAGSSAPTHIAGVVTEDKGTDSDGAGRLWNLAMADLKQEKYMEAMNIFKDFAKMYPKSPRAPYAVLGLGLIQYKLGKYKEAALSFNELIDLNSKKGFSALAWLGQGCVFAMLKQNEDARLFLNEVKVKFPRGAEAKLADQLIKKQKKVPLDLLPLFPSWAGPYKGK